MFGLSSYLKNQELRRRGRMMAYDLSPPKWPWRDYLTDEEAAKLAAADAAKAEWERLNVERAAIVNRAIQRAKYALTKST